MTAICFQCRRPLDEHDRHVRFTLPDSVLQRRADLDAEDSWMSHASPQASVMMTVEGVGSYVRALVPVHLTGGYSVTFGVWVEVPRGELHRALQSWFAPHYVDLTIEGHLANELPLWQVLGAPLHIEVLHPDHTPYGTSSPDSALSGVIHGIWDHELVLSALPR